MIIIQPTSSLNLILFHFPFSQKSTMENGKGGFRVSPLKETVEQPHDMTRHFLLLYGDA